MSATLSTAVASGAGQRPIPAYTMLSTGVCLRPTVSVGPPMSLRGRGTSASRYRPGSWTGNRGRAPINRTSTLAHGRARRPPSRPPTRAADGCATSSHERSPREQPDHAEGRVGTPGRAGSDDCVHVCLVPPCEPLSIRVGLRIHGGQLFDGSDQGTKGFLLLATL